MTLLIGIAGRMRTGKSSLANLIQEWLANDDNKICIDSFAEALRQELAEMLWDKEESLPDKPAFYNWEVQKRMIERKRARE